jgi:hypothetical protein
MCLHLPVLRVGAGDFDLDQDLAGLWGRHIAGDDLDMEICVVRLISDTGVVRKRMSDPHTRVHNGLLHSLAHDVNCVCYPIRRE